MDNTFYTWLQRMTYKFCYISKNLKINYNFNYFEHTGIVKGFGLKKNQ